MHGKKFEQRMTVFACIVVIAPVFLVGCASGRVNQFKNFAQAGIAYSDSIETLTKRAGETAVDADSLILMKRRKNLSPDERGSEIVKYDELLKERFVILGNLRRHAQLLKSYFVSIAGLANSNAPSDIGTSTEQMVNAIETLGSEIKKSQKISDGTNAQYAGGIAKIAIAHFQNAALEQELRKRSKTIEREIDLQQAAFEAMAGQIRTDIQVVLNTQELNEVVSPFKDSKEELPKDWAERRREILLSNLSLGAIDAASDAAKNMKTAFVSLVENRFTETDYQALIKDVNEIIDLVEKAQGKDKK